jgi:short-chain fatty acids transporter
VMRALARPLVALMQRFMPDAFIFALLLTILTFVLCIFLAEASPDQAVNAWGNGFWKLQTFAAQMAMILITGLVLAQTPLVRGLLKRIVELAVTPARAYVLVGFVTGIAALFSWGIAIILGAILAREMANSCLRRGVTVHYPLLVATGYAGFIVWHQGLSSSIALKIAEPGHFLADRMGVVPVSETIFAWQNIVIALTVVVTLPFVMMLLRPAPEACVSIREELVDEDEQKADSIESKTPASILNNARVFNLLIAAAGLVYLWYHFYTRGGGLDLNIINFVFLTAGLLLTRSPIHYVELAMAEGRGIGAILLQFPFYAGIMGMMVDTGLGKIVADWFVSIASAETLPFWGFVSGGLINLFVPSGGGQWAVQGPVMIEAAQQLGADMPRVAMGVAMGDQWTNMLQPFWAIPALAIVGLKVRDIMGYTAVVFVWTGLIFSLGILYL